MYLIVGIFSYCLLIENEHIFPIGSMVLTIVNTLPMAIGKGVIIVSIFLALPLFLFPARTAIHELF